jgi:hypothetical protein
LLYAQFEELSSFAVKKQQGILLACPVEQVNKFRILSKFFET